MARMIENLDKFGTNDRTSKNNSRNSIPSGVYLHGTPRWGGYRSPDSYLSNQWASAAKVRDCEKKIQSLTDKNRSQENHQEQLKSTNENLSQKLNQIPKQ